MEIYFNVPKEVVKTINDTMTSFQFKALLTRSMPFEIFNSHYSTKKPCWYIAQYIDEDTVLYYADNWADKTPKEITLDDLYESWKLQGLENCYFNIEQNDSK